MDEKIRPVQHWCCQAIPECAGICQLLTVTDENIWETVEDAYVYAFPLVLMDATEISATNTEEAVTGKAPVNQFIHSVAQANAQFRMW